MGTISTYQKSINASTKNLAEVRQFIAELALNHGFLAPQVEDVRLAVDEAITNIIKHAYKEDASNRIDIEVTFEDDSICIQIQDFGRTFDFDHFPEPDIKKKIKEKKRGGMGLYLIQSLMDSVRYSKNDGMNEMVMCKQRAS